VQVFDFAVEKVCETGAAIAVFAADADGYVVRLRELEDGRVLAGPRYSLAREGNVTVMRVADIRYSTLPFRKIRR
jgi:hypothetical protein